MKIEEQIRALESFARSSSKTARRSFFAALAHKSSKVRWAAAVLLADTHDKRTVPRIARLLRDVNREVRYFAAESLGILLGKTGKAPSALFRLLRDKDSLVRVQALDTFSEICDKRYLPSISKLVLDEDPLVRMHAAGCIADLRGKRYKKLLRIQWAKEHDPSAEIGILLALCCFGDWNLFERLLGKLTSNNYRVRCAAANCLDGLNLRPKVRRMALSSLMRARRHAIGKADIEAVNRTIRSLRLTL